jgi:hypothetical protein
MSALQQAAPFSPIAATDWFEESFYGDLGPCPASPRMSDDEFSEWERCLIARDLERFLTEHDC